MDRVYTRLPTSSIILNVSYVETSICRWHVDLVHHAINRKFVITSTLEQSMGSTFPAIVPAYKSHYAPEKYPAMYDIVIEICTCSLISVAKGCIVGYRTVALWYMHNRLIGNYEAWQYDHPNFKSPGKIYIFCFIWHRFSIVTLMIWIYFGTDWSPSIMIAYLHIISDHFLCCFLSGLPDINAIDTTHGFSYLSGRTSYR